MKRIIALVSLICLTFICFMPSSAYATAQPQFYPELYDISSLRSTLSWTDAQIKAKMDSTGLPEQITDVKYYNVRAKFGGTSNPLENRLVVVFSNVNIDQNIVMQWNTYTYQSGRVEMLKKAGSTETNIKVAVYYQGTQSGGLITAEPTGSQQGSGTQWTQFYATESMTEIPVGFVVDWNSLTIKNITSSSADLSWAQKGSGDYTLRLTNPTGGDQDNVKTITVTRSSDPTTQTYTITGLKPTEQYGAYVSLSGGAESGRNFVTNSSTYSISAMIAGQNLALNSTTKVPSYGDIEIKSTDWTRYDLYMNGHFIVSKTGLPQSSSQTILATLYSSYIQAENNLEIWGYNSSGIVDKKFSYGFTTADPTIQNGSGLLKPTTPTKPDSAWDLVGWFEYGVNWLIYIVSSIVWLLASLGGMIQDIWNSSTGFVSMLTSMFSFLPPQVTTLMGVGMGVAILLRIFGR